jgi:hypothetical protein
MTIANAPVGKISRRIGKNTKTWQIFEALFLGPEMSYPHTISPIPRGEAINLAIGLNCCNRQWAEEQSLPRDFIQFSAKAIKGPDDASWALEISTNHRQQRTSSANWMDKFLPSSPSPSPDTTSSSQGDELAPSVRAPVQDEPSHFDAVLEAWMKGAEGEGEKEA